jgi:hypothetical protein
MLITESLEVQLAERGITLNSTLVQTIQAASEQTVADAIAALEEAMSISEINRPSGWLKRAIDSQWKPNAKPKTKHLMEEFGKWFELARKNGLVIASMKQADGQILVFDRDGNAHLFAEMLAVHPTASLSPCSPDPAIGDQTLERTRVSHCLRGDCQPQPKI